MLPKVYRQGDVLFYEKLTPEFDMSMATKTAPNAEGDHVLALGEVTGHRHRVSGKQAKLVKLGSRRFLDVPKKAVIKHEEHKPLPLPKGQYEVVIEREYEIGGKVRAVAD